MSAIRRPISALGARADRPGGIHRRHGLPSTATRPWPLRSLLAKRGQTAGLAKPVGSDGARRGAKRSDRRARALLHRGDPGPADGADSQELRCAVQVANVISIAMFRELGPLVSAIVLTGFAGASIAAEIGTMVESEEIEALEAQAISPIRFLVVPRMIATTLMMVCVAVIGDLTGVTGGLVVGNLALGIGAHQYLAHTFNAIELRDFTTGLIKSGVFESAHQRAGVLPGFGSHRRSAGRRHRDDAHGRAHDRRPHHRRPALHHDVLLLRMVSHAKFHRSAGGLQEIRRAFGAR